MRLTIRNKLILGYLAMTLLMVLSSTYAITRLHDINRLTHAMFHLDFDVLQVAKQMTNLLAAMENAEKKYLILKDPSLAEIYWQMSAEFKGYLGSLQQMPSKEMDASAAQLRKLVKQYEDLFRQEMAAVEGPGGNSNALLFAEESRRLLDAMSGTIHGLQRRAEKSVDRRMDDIKTKSEQASNIAMMLTVMSLVVGLFLAAGITYDITRRLRRIERATGRVAEGNFDDQISVGHDDEIGTLANAFDAMTGRLKVLEAMRLDASPLTGLPGNLAIEQEISTRLKSGKAFSLCHVDLDNFKPFADAYGYAWGSEVIKEVAVILQEAARAGGDAVFLGHIGGDDFLFLAEPDQARRMCDRVVAEFDRRILKFYSETDRRRGAIEAKNREGRLQTFPLISVTISIVSNEDDTYRNALDMAKMAAEVKNYGKGLAGSNVVTKEAMENAR